jgi:hypothetical protein
MSLSGEEARLRAELPVYIGSFNQPSYLRQMVETLLSNGFGNVIVADNASTSGKTLDLLAEFDGRAGVRVWRIGENVGPTETVRRITKREKGSYAFSDPDLALAEVLPDDFLLRLFDLSRRYRARKVGLALEIPSPEEARDLRFTQKGLGEFTVQEWERRFWKTEVEPGVYRANVDTTFFVWNRGIRVDLRRDYMELRRIIRPGRIARRLPHVGHTDLRVASPGFVARHLPWYTDDRFPEDERAYYLQSTSYASTWLRNSA